MDHDFPKALFFDFDGVLVDSNAIKTQAFKELFANYGEDVVGAVVNYHRLHGGISRVEKIRHAFEIILRMPLSADHLAMLATDYSKRVMDKVVRAGWIAGAYEFLEKYHRALPLFVISGTPEKELKSILQLRKMDHYFSAALGSPIKKPQHIRSLLSRYTLNPHECVFVGDALTDYNAAVDTGLFFIGVQGDVKFPDGTCVLPDCTTLDDALHHVAI